MLGRPERLEDACFASLQDRMGHINELQDEIEAITTTKTTGERFALLDEAGIPGGPVLTYNATLADPHVQAREMVATVDHPIIAPMQTIAPPTKFRTPDFDVTTSAPLLGQHTPRCSRRPGSTRSRATRRTPPVSPTRHTPT